MALARREFVTGQKIFWVSVELGVSRHQLLSLSLRQCGGVFQGPVYTCRANDLSRIRRGRSVGRWAASSSSKVDLPRPFGPLMPMWSFGPMLMVSRAGPCWLSAPLSVAAFPRRYRRKSSTPCLSIQSCRSTPSTRTNSRLWLASACRLMLPS